MPMTRKLCTLLILTLPALAGAQAPAKSDPIAKVVGSFFALSVADLDATSKWYQEKLGLTIVLSGGRSGRFAGFVALEGNGLLVELIKNDDATTVTAEPEMRHGYFKGGAIVSDFDRAVALLRERGVEIAYGPYPARADQRANLIFKDNAGNLIQLFGDYAKK